MAILSIDVGGSSIKHAVIDIQGDIKVKGTVATPKTLAEFYDALAAVKDNYAQEYELTGVGCSFPGAVDDAAGVINGSSAIDYIHEFPIRQELEARLKLPVSMENDANCAALGETWVGNGRDYQDMLFLVIGTGVGGAVVKGKKIHHGKHFHGGEFGYMTVDEKGTILSNAGSTRVLAEHVAKAKGLPIESMNGEKVFALLADGDNDAAEAVEIMYSNLARAIYNLQYSFDPEIFVIGGAISARSDFADEIMKRIDKILTTVKVAQIRPKVVCCRHGNDANLLGAVYDFLNKHPQK